MKSITVFGAVVVVAAASLVSSASGAYAQTAAPKEMSMLCKTSIGGRGIIRGYVELTLSNIGASPIPKGHTMYAQKGKKTIKFKAPQPIPPGGAATFRTSSRAFMSQGECRGWY